MHTITRRLKTGAWNREDDPMGWLTFWRPLPGQAGDAACLSLHCDWAGPVKALDTGVGKIQRIDLFGTFKAADPRIDGESALATERLRQALNARAGDWFEGKPLIDEWTPPPAGTLRGWLIDAGCEAAIDKEGDLRAILKRRGCDGQIRVSRQEGFLRFTMPLGRGRGLDPNADAAMTRLCAEANARCRLARIARVQEEKRVRFDAQVDLSGLPWLEEPDGPTLAFWREMIRMTALALELALRRLGLELPLLAAKRHPELIHWIMTHPATTQPRPGKPEAGKQEE